MLTVMEAPWEERLEMGRKGRAIVRERCDLVAVMDRRRTVIENIVASRSAS